MSIVYFGFMFLTLIVNSNCYSKDNRTSRNVQDINRPALTKSAQEDLNQQDVNNNASAWIKSVQKAIKSYEKIENCAATYDKLTQQIEMLLSAPAKAPAAVAALTLMQRITTSSLDTKLKAAQNNLTREQDKINAFVTKLKTIPVAQYIVYHEFLKTGVYPTSIDNFTNLGDGLPNDNDIAFYNNAPLLDSQTNSTLTYSDSYEKYCNSEYKIEIKLKNNVKQSAVAVAQAQIEVPENQTVVSENQATEQQDQTVVSENQATEQQYQTVVSENQATEQQDQTVVSENQATEQQDQTVVSEDQATEQQDQTVVSEDQATEQKTTVNIPAEPVAATPQQATSDTSKTRYSNDCVQYPGGAIAKRRAHQNNRS